VAGGGSHDENSLFSRVLRSYARVVVRRPAAVLSAVLMTAVLAFWATSKLTINANQLDLIRQDLVEVQDLHRVIKMIGGAGHLIVSLKSDNSAVLEQVAEDIAAQLKPGAPAQPDDWALRDQIRTVNYKLSVDFMIEKMGLFVETEDLRTVKSRVTEYLDDQRRRADPFFIEIVPTEPKKLELDDLIAKYGHVGKKSLRSDYNFSDDGKVLLLFVKPMWDSSRLDLTKKLVEQLQDRMARYAATNSRGVQLLESYDRAMPPKGTVTYGFTGAYKMSVDDSFAIEESLGPVTIIAMLAILLITIAFFRRWAPTLIVVSGMAVGTLLAMGFAWVAFRELNMITSILGGILMGFGVDYGIQYIFRARIELGAGTRWDTALEDAIVHAGRPATVAAIVTAGSFFLLVVSEFRGFSQFGLLAGAGTLIIAFTLFCWSPAILALAGRRNPELPARLIGITPPPPPNDASGAERRIPQPVRLLGVSSIIVLVLCAAAFQWKAPGATRSFPSRLLEGVRFDYNTRALLPAHMPSVELQDEINDRFGTSADTVAIYSPDLAGAKEVYDELTQHPDKYPGVATPVISIYTFVPPGERAAANAAIMAQWKTELAGIDPALLPEDVRPKWDRFMKVLDAKPYGVEGVPALYADEFKSVLDPSTGQPAVPGYLTFLYAKEDLRDGKAMVRFADQLRSIKTESGREYRAAGPAILYAMLARQVLKDGILSVVLASIWILLMHWLDFRSPSLALASVVPLVLGLVTMLGIMSMADEPLNFMNIIILPILLGFGVSHGLYLLHRFLEGTSPVVALQSVGAAVASSTLTAIAGFAALFAASHKGLQSMGLVACIGLTMTLIVSFTVLAAVLQMLHDKRGKKA